ncbi:hypothetical protein PAECIP112173_00686 [Paenibacillus sp. JJ-100]|uniref:DUF6115 domain-containing protein n=1 Tax=Paenibacillus sp. JJ-100 TaxID=2974896 RepID=UPI0022FF5E92|nr:hypothetical protein [Paenibacillus sp. JJ-100]CAI6032393.1 hypothetical protein PAECIP112173_00686 [Paenibacillus sp. JJ-100]
MSPWIIIVILGACAIAYAFIMPRKDKVQQPSHQLVQEMESTLEHYMTEIEQENDALIQRVAELKGEATAADQRLQSQLQELQQRLDQLEQQKVRTTETVLSAPVDSVLGYTSDGLQAQRLLENIRADANQQPESATSESQVKEENIEPQRESIKDRYKELFRLHDNGKSMDAIAKQTGIQLGEVQLILQLADREEN